MQGTVRDSTLKSYIYTHITDNMQRSAADKIERVSAEMRALWAGTDRHPTEHLKRP